LLDAASQSVSAKADDVEEGKIEWEGD